MKFAYDIIIVGGGHAGCEAAVAAATQGAHVLLISMSLTTVGQMSCNPAMGGVAKGQIVKEIDAMGGWSGHIADASAIQFRMLNRSKGPAMWSPRTQNDRQLFARLWQRKIENTPNLSQWQDMVVGLSVEQGRIHGVQTQMGITFTAKAVVLTNGTFLNGLIHIGSQKFGGGRIGERSATGLTAQLQALGFQTARMKTGTPPRIDGRSIQYSATEEQPGEDPMVPFSHFYRTPPPKKQRSCYMTYTNPQVHDLLRTHADQSPMFSGQITAIGPRYCPSIEDKVFRFADKERHLLFLEPEGWDTHEVYVNGFSTSMPQDIQFKALSLVPGLEKAHFLRPGYAIEYDYFCPTQLLPSLQTRSVEGLFFAGQINGTTGYEEAAGQGLMAGINAYAYIKGASPLVLARDEAYIGVLIDDLVHKGTQEPYRMFTSRAEHRLILRQDNAHLRLTDYGVARGLLPPEKGLQVAQLREQIVVCTQRMAQIKLSLGGKKKPLAGWLLHPELNWQGLIAEHPALSTQFADISAEAQAQAEIQIIYAPYFERANAWLAKKAQFDRVYLQQDFDYSRVQALSNEGKEKLQQHQPKTLAQAEQISGVSAADVAILSSYLGK